MSTSETELDPVLDRAWGLAPQVSIRREAFGGLLYHFGTRRLSFLKDPRLLSIVERLDDAPSARAACAVAGLDDAAMPAYQRALARLAATEMLRERSL